jgi:hypothetical protein
MPQTAIKRDFLTVGQASERLGLAERTVIHYVDLGELYAERLDPERPRSDLIISLKSIEAFEKKRAQAG